MECYNCQESKTCPHDSGKSSGGFHFYGGYVESDQESPDSLPAIFDFSDKKLYLCK